MDSANDQGQTGDHTEPTNFERLPSKSTEPTDSDRSGKPTGITVREYADKLALPDDFVAQLGLKGIHYDGRASVKIPYYDPNGQEVGARFIVRDPTSPVGIDFAWKKGAKPVPYGLWRLARACSTEGIVLVPDEIDCHILWAHGVPALAITSPAVRNLEALLDKFAEIVVLGGGIQSTDAIVDLLRSSGLKERVQLATLKGNCRPLVSLHQKHPDDFRPMFRQQLQKKRLVVWEQELADAKAAAAWDLCKELAAAPNILDRFADDLQRAGVVGEGRLGKLLYLATTSRLLGRPVSVIVKGSSSCGKSHTTMNVLKFFPASAFHTLSSMSEKALLYSSEPLIHRMLVVCELDGVGGKFATYLIRTLLSEGRINYEVTSRVGGEMTTVRVKKEGPTGLIITTTQQAWHTENENRMVSVTADDSPEQTRRVLVATAAAHEQPVDMTPWHALQDLLEYGERRVCIPFAVALAEQFSANLPPRIRRDYNTLTSLMEAHAILHQAKRQRDSNGWIIATLEDYGAVRELVADLLADGIALSVPEIVRETIAALQEALKDSPNGVSETILARSLGLDKSVVSRRLKQAAECGFATNRQIRKGCAARWVMGDPLPADRELLPTIEQLRQATQSCTLAP